MASSKSKTVSTSTPETDVGSHVFHVVGYSQQKAIYAHKKKPIASGHFSVSGHDWQVLLMAGIHNENHPDCILFLLMLMNTDATGVLASFELKLVDQSTGLMPCSVHKGAPMVFHGKNDVGTVWIKQSLVESPRYIQNDRLTVECIVTVIKEPLFRETKSLPRVEVPPSNMAEQFGSLLETELGAESADVTFSVETEQFGSLLETDVGVDVNFSVRAETFKAHKIVLATRSPVFKAEFYGPMKEEGLGPITIKDVQPGVFRALLRFIYTDSLPPMDNLEADDRSNMIRHLLVAADRYAIDRLKLICQSILCENLNVQTVATTLALADQHNCDMLKDACIDFISCSNEMDGVLSSQGYKDLKRTCPAVIIDVFEKTSKFRKA